MRKLLLFLFMILMIPISASADVIINEENFPDENFRNYLIEYYGQNGVISDAEISEINFLFLADLNIENLKGIESFTELRELVCGHNPLTSLDISKNIKLEKLECDIAQLTSLDVSMNIALTSLSCTFNNLISLDVSKNSELTFLACPGNQLTSLDVSHNNKLEELNCERNELVILNVSYNPELAKLECNSNKLTSLDLSQCPKLTYLYCPCNQIKGVEMNNLVGSLLQQENAGFHVLSTSKSEGNVCNKAQVSIAKQKGWTVYCDGSEYEGCDPVSVAESFMGKSKINDSYSVDGKRLPAPQRGMNILKMSDGTTKKAVVK